MQYGEMIAQLKAQGFTLKSEVSSRIGGVAFQYWEFATDDGATITIPFSRGGYSDGADVPGAMLALVNARLTALSLHRLGVPDTAASRPPQPREGRPGRPGLRSTK